MNYTLPVSELQKLISNLSTPIPSPTEGVHFKRFLILEKDGVAVIPSNSDMIVSNYSDHKIIDELEFRWINGCWNLVITPGLKYQMTSLFDKLAEGGFKESSESLESLNK